MTISLGKIHLIGKTMRGYLLPYVNAVFISTFYELLEIGIVNIKIGFIDVE